MMIDYVINYDSKKDLYVGSCPTGPSAIHFAHHSITRVNELMREGIKMYEKQNKKLCVGSEDDPEVKRILADPLSRKILLYLASGERDDL